MDSRWGRVARGWAAAICATAVAAVSHTLGGGAPPTLFALVVTLIISGTVCTLAAGKTLSLARLTGAVAISQALFHTVFSSLGTPVAAAHTHSPSIVEPVAAHHAGGMWVAHVVAGLITIAALRHGEAAFWGFAVTARLFFARLLAVMAAPAPVSRASVALGDVDLTRPRTAADRLSGLRYRGPPATVGAL